MMRINISQKKKIEMKIWILVGYQTEHIHCGQNSHTNFFFLLSMDGTQIYTTNFDQIIILIKQISQRLYNYTHIMIKITGQTITLWL